ncbi:MULTISPECIES: preprotein translocase subunit SecA [Acetobacter]|jgi:preprotein translocase subunit SecA|uniref:Protein translocase subunit SecA n=1 Tax=Acetobacter lovaniensis TaxID=104100 RepID=A0A841QI38_9PROT|nr:preprotein translocase subunit SecA [Acetobacter lovaniensis]MBB6457823.1 preprotein translocase subunit SecA [Acetobacter lovaniensis]MCI1698294.1 preprotein translocase subunit SecA [Acetobacter lovaniensis]MCI1794899.1 preprotein translocase subunit SecA [Acetobacter lovaniensis]MCP1240069.1 preprotein translocase subunit SecA [Acetobacter lovaniensis]NHN82086.1 preprotein translocase subunit SecA [Acetobacter lovaniensis]
MLSRFVRALFGTANDRTLKAFQRRVSEINALEPEIQALDDAALAAKTIEFRERLAKGATLDDLLPEAFAVTREASRRVLGMRHFDVQLIGGMVLHSGRIAEMRTGEGKTLVATLAVYLSALSGKGVHVVTVNDYLASRDAAEMGQLYTFLGLTTGVIVPNMPDEQRRQAYAADITYGTNNEFGFDYLRDNMKYQLNEMVQRPFHHAIVDEVDSILIDEARTPLIISGPAEDSSDLYRSVDSVVARLVQDETAYEKDEKFRTVILTDAGSDAVELLLREEGVLDEGGLYDLHHVAVVHHVMQSLRAHTLFARDVDYIVRDGKVVIIDEFTGRMMEGRRYSDGLHQALEAKEHVEVQQENQTLASITFQNFFRLYPRLSGMTGTAMTEADEFAEIYNLDVVAIPTNRPVARKDGDDEVYLTEAEKFAAVVKLINEVHQRQQPILVGTTSIEKSEALSALLKRENIPHHVLNARFHEMEAKIVAQAGAPGSITIATNMAGRGTDIKLGGNVDMLIAQQLGDMEDTPERAAAEQEIRDRVIRDHATVREAGGLYVIGTERHESRRIDNQLRGRAGRQGDPGNSKFFISLQDDLMRIFGSDRMGSMFQKMGMQEGEAIVHPWLSKALERAQKKVESRNFDMRKNTLKYDDVMNDQRKEVYAQRREFMAQDDVSAIVADAQDDVTDMLVARHIPEKSFAEQWDVEGLTQQVHKTFGLDLPIADWAREDGMDAEGVAERISQAVTQSQAARAANIGPDLMRFIEKQILLTTYDAVWKEHLHALDQLRQGIGLRAYGQKDPLNEYKHEAFQLFTFMLEEMRLRVASLMAHVEVSPPPMEDPFADTAAIHADPGVAGYASEPGTGLTPGASPGMAVPIGGSAIMPDDPSSWGETPRNALCPCGSGKKYKHCHGQLG